MRLLLVYNPHAGHRHAAALYPEAVALFREKGLTAEPVLTEGPGHAGRIVRDADFGSYDGVVAAGGDGTLYEVVNGYYANPARGRIPVGLLPIGTGNAFARDLKIDAGHWREAVEIIASGKRRRVDVGRFRTGGIDYYFLNILGLGFVADVTNTADRLKVFGNVAYTLGVLVQTLFLHSYPVRVEADGRVIEKENLFAEISNTRYTSNFLMAPKARIDCRSRMRPDAPGENRHGLAEQVAIRQAPQGEVLRPDQPLERVHGVVQSEHDHSAIAHPIRGGPVGSR